ncbi:hypothetical protein PENSPDRAFT_752089 [Peniophora sp. CONT]|nr:hypothetical protein PENSPDRAFT_752089 [Peniophora sp. CONT]
MFSLKLVAAALPFLLVAAAPSPVEDWKTLLGWDGKVFTVEQIESNAHLDTRAANAGGVFFCTDANFQGNCAYVTGFSSGACVGVGSDFNDDVSSFGPDPGLTCNIYSDAGCTGRLTGDVINPGINNLADFNNNDAKSSFSCTF